MNRFLNLGLFLSQFCFSINFLIDSFVESMMGKYGRVPALPINILNRNEKDITSFIDETIMYLIGLSNIFDSVKDSDLLNTRDEMLGLFNKLRYLLTLK